MFKKNTNMYNIEQNNTKSEKKPAIYSLKYSNKN